MKWKDFKDTVDVAVESFGVDPDKVEIEYIDTHAPNKVDDIDVGIDDDRNKITVTSF